MRTNVVGKLLSLIMPGSDGVVDYELRLRMGIAVGFCWGAFFVFLGNGIAVLFLDRVLDSSVSLVTALLFLAMALLFKMGRIPLYVLRNGVVILVYLNALYLVILTHGSRSMHMMWLLLIPLFAQFILLGESGVVWYVVSLLTVVGLFYAESVGVTFPGTQTTPSHDLILWGVTIFGCIAAQFLAAFLFKATILGSAKQLERSKIDADTNWRRLNNLFQKIEENVESLGEASTRFAGASEKLKEIFSTTHDKTIRISDSTKEIGQAMNVISLEVSIVDRSMEKIADIAAQARKIAEESDLISKETFSSMEKLREEGQESVNITSYIQKTAKELKLLSLNAAIKAANAGEFGQGFAVVANQVKTLAEKTSDAISDVSEIIQSIRSLTDDSSEKIMELVNSIKSIFEYQKSIADSVEEQNRVIDSITDSISDTATISTTINKNVRDVVSVSASTQKEVDKTFDEATNLAAMSGSLARLMERKEAKVG